MRWLLPVALLCAACPERPEVPTEDDAGVPTNAEWPDGTVQIFSARDGTILPATVALESGAQGGFHVPLEYRIDGKTQREATFSIKVRRARDGRLVSRSQLYDDVSGMWKSGDVTVFMCPSPIGISVIDEELRFEVVVTNSAGKVLGVATASSTLRCPDANKGFCESICKG